MTIGPFVAGIATVRSFASSASNSVTVPAQSGAWYVIVTGNIDNAYPMCGPYWLQEYY